MTPTDLLPHISIFQVHTLISTSCTHMCTQTHNTYKPYHLCSHHKHKCVHTRKIPAEMAGITVRCTHLCRGKHTYTPQLQP